MAEKGRQLLKYAGYDIGGSEPDTVVHHLRVAQKLGSPILRCVAGNLLTRDEGHDMAALADRAAAILQEACNVAEEMGMRIAAENHVDFTVREWAAILARVNGAAFGFTVDCANVAFDLDDPVRLAKIMAPYALTTHYKNYRIIRTKCGLALANCALGEGDIDIVAMAEILAEHNPHVNINIEIHSQFAPFKLDILEETFFERHPPPPGDGLAWYLNKAWEKEILETHPADLPDGEEAWKREHDDLKDSVCWAADKLSHIISK
jgi:sugar phosphate isomerase/epimerase